MNNKKVIVSVVAVVAVAAAAIGIAASNKKAPTPVTSVTSTGSGQTTTTTSDTTATSTTTTPVADKNNVAYKDGTYTATGSYQSPGGPDKVGVTVTLKNDIITSASVTPMPGDRESAHYQSLFASGYQAVVVGKDISTLHLDAVSGSSLTPIGFNDAIAQIKAQAKA